MDTDYKNTNGRFIEIMEKHGEEVTCMGWISHLTSAGEDSAAPLRHRANDPDRSSFPYIDLPCVPVKAAAFPKCP